MTKKSGQRYISRDKKYIIELIKKHWDYKWIVKALYPKISKRNKIEDIFSPNWKYLKNQDAPKK